MNVFKKLKSHHGLILVVGLWVGTIGNVVLWGHVMPQVGAMTLMAFAVAWLAVWFALLQWFAWPWVLKGMLLGAALVSALTSYYMLVYGVVIDASMIRNALATNTHEVLDLMSWQMGLYVAAVFIPMLWVVTRWRLEWHWSWQSLGSRLGLSGLALVYALGLLWASYADFSSLMRNDRSIRYQINPFNTVYSVGHALTPKLGLKQQVLISVADDVKPLAPTKAPPLVVLVVGETVRAANFGLSGYARSTTPLLKNRLSLGQLVYWSQAQSCGTNTEVSVPCMFSPLTGREGADRPAQHQNLLDVLQKAGLGVYWIDNQSGCKGVCDRIPHHQISGRGEPQLCDQGECFDEVLVSHLDQAVNSFTVEQKQRGMVVVLHMMGSHGPAYYKRSPTQAKTFLPECASSMLTDCTPEELRNTYDNSIVYTDQVLDQVMNWLEQNHTAHESAMLYISDHGESLGEKGMYLHGAPSWMAPTEQTHIPILAWYSKAWQRSRKLSVACLQSTSDQPVGHDFVFHSVLGMLGVQTKAYQPELDWQRDCVGRV